MQDGSQNGGYTPKDYKERDFGMVVSSLEQIKEHQADYAEIFAEGSPQLKKLLNFLWDHDIETVGCCVGHADALVTYYKFHLLKPFEEIEKEEYDVHKHSWRYFTVKEDKVPYFAYRPIAEEPVKKQVSNIRESLKEKLPDFDCFVDANQTQTMITIIHNSFLPEIMREQFFKTLNDVLDCHLVKKKELKQTADREHIRSGQKKPLQEQIQEAKKKQSLMENQQKTNIREEIDRHDDTR